MVDAVNVMIVFTNLDEKHDWNFSHIWKIIIQKCNECIFNVHRYVFKLFPRRVIESMLLCTSLSANNINMGQRNVEYPRTPSPWL